MVLLILGKYHRLSLSWYLHYDWSVYSKLKNLSNKNLPPLFETRDIINTFANLVFLVGIVRYGILFLLLALCLGHKSELTVLTLNSVI